MERKLRAKSLLIVSCCLSMHNAIITKADKAKLWINSVDL